MLKKVATFALICFGTFSIAKANPLLPGQSVSPDKLFPNGNVLAVTGGTVSNGPLMTTYLIYAYQDFSSVVCAGCLDILYVFDNVGAATVNEFSVTNFAGAVTDVGYNAGSSPGVDPSTITRSADGSTINFLFSPALGDASTGMLVIETNVTAYTSGGFTVKSSDFSATQGSFAPLTPEPGTFALFGTGLLGLVGVARRKLKV